MKFGGIFVALLFALAACSSEPEPREPQTTSAPTPTSTATAPTMPAQAREDSPEGAAAFVDHWVDVFNYAAATGDVDELSNLSSPDCAGCQEYIDLYTETYEAGGYFKGGEWRLRDIEIETKASIRQVFVHVDSASGTQREDADSSVGPTSKEDTDLVFLVAGLGADPKISAIRRPQV